MFRFIAHFDVGEGIQSLSTLVGLHTLLLGSRCVHSALLRALSSLPVLKHLALHSCEFIGSLNNLEPLANTLCELDLSWCTVPVSDLRTLTSLTALQTLDLSCLKMTDEILESLGSLPRLECLNVKWCEGITAEGIRSTSSSLPRLRLLQSRFEQELNQASCD